MNHPSHSNAVFTLHRGTTPLLVSVPHAGLSLAEGMQPALTLRAKAIEDADWHLDRLYGFVMDLGASLIVPKHARYVIDLNRPGDNQPMYPGANNTELCPTRFFTGDALYVDGAKPDDAEVQRRRRLYWEPYHAALREELDRLRGMHGHAVLFDAHSIKAELPWLFEGRLPDLNLGTVHAASCAASLRTSLIEVLQAQTDYSHVADGRFKGGHITRHFGQPSQGVHAVQLEMGWHTYLEDGADTPQWHAQRASALTQRVLRPLITTMQAWRPAR
jgi:N-formylglutamate deformylase